MADTNLASNGQTSQQQLLASIYWDCQNVPIKNPYLARFLLTFIELRQWRLSAAKAYANWRKEKITAEKRLCQLGYDCIDVPLTTKNSVDKKIIADCIRDSKNLSSDIYILVTGDGDFCSLVRQWKAKGKYTIIFSQSNASQNLIQLADQHYCVDPLPELIVKVIQPQTTFLQSHIGYNEAIECLIEAIKTASNENKRASFGYIGNLMRQSQLFLSCKKFPSIHTPDGKVISQFNKLAEAAEKEGKVKIENQELFLI